MQQVIIKNPAILAPFQKRQPLQRSILPAVGQGIRRLKQRIHIHPITLGQAIERLHHAIITGSHALVEALTEHLS